jgi:hypothetical protein
LRWRRGGKLAGRFGKGLQAAFQSLAAQFPIFSHYFPLELGQRRQPGCFFVHRACMPFCR